ncbi:S8 family serine peptidase [Actinoplanes sp. GCM10030250]|uniref:S8 family serine peptidase n=1 Tax=Actinoplanes sp. GCM10030250 TaxID=3273376 RepID=UPI00361CA04E
MRALLIAAALVMSALPAPAQAAQAAAGPAAVTLITGDRVTLQGTTASVRPGPGRRGISFLTRTAGGHRHVIPSDALPLLRDGRLDRRLFDVTLLAEVGDDLPLLLTGPSAGQSAVYAGAARVTRDLSAVGMLAVRADVAGRAALWSGLTSGTPDALTLRTGVQKVWLDGRRRLDLDRSVPQIGAPTAWQAGLDGTGVTVAVLDSGIDLDHPDLAGQVAGTENFTGAPTGGDEVGHGTHVASTIAGTGAASGGRYRGVAPGAKLLIGKVCETTFCTDSAVLAGMIWAAERAQVVSISLGEPDTPDIDPLEQAVNQLTAEHDTLFVISAGNRGGTGTVGTPSTADAALSVGAVDRDDRLTGFSSRGPRKGDAGLKPDITAPGAGIVAARAGTGGYTPMSGTSMAAPHVAGAAAILTQQHPGWSSRLRKNTLVASAQPAEGVSAYDQGAGRVDVARQIGQTVTVDEGSVSFGVQAWPHDDDAPVQRTVTYRNSGPGAVNLTLATTGAPFSVAATSLTVPAGGTAATTVTAGTREDLAEGPLGGHLTATATGGVRATTALGVNREPEAYDVTVRTTNRDGTPSSEHVVELLGLDGPAVVEANAKRGTEVVRVPRGRYGVHATVYHGDETTVLTDTELVVDRDLILTADARTAAPVRLTPPQAGATTALAAVSADWTTGAAYHPRSVLAFTFDDLYAGPLSPVSKPFFLASAGGSFGVAGADFSFHNSPWVTDLCYFSPGRMFAGLIRAPALGSLAALDATYAADSPSGSAPFGGQKANVARFSEESTPYAVALPFDLPFRRTEYVNPDVAWSGEFNETLTPDGGFAEPISGSTSPHRTLRAGRTYREDWNRGVHGPNVTHPPYPGLWAARDGDTVTAVLPLFGDGAGHPGQSWFATETTALYRGTTKLSEGTEFTLPAGRATYRLESTATRGAPHTLATEVRASWTFRSAHTAAFQRLPLHTVRFAPPLDDTNTARSGTRLTIPLFVEHQPGSETGRIRSLAVDVSFDDGRTWRKAPLTADRRLIMVTHPPGPGFVSLRATAADTAGNSVTQTVLRAYALR